jgi:hypothetical protein
VRVFVYFPLLLVIGCLNEPDAVGFNLLPDTDNPSLSRRTDTVYANTDSLAFTLINSESDSRMFVGNYQSSTAQNYLAWSFVEFAFGPFDSLKNDLILNSKIRLKANYSFGGSSASPLAMELYRATEQWHSDSLTLLSVQANRPNYAGNDTVGSRRYTVSDDTSWFEIDISDTSIVRQSIIQGSAGLGYGLLIQPQPLNMIGIKGFVSGNVTLNDERPKLAITFIHLGDTVTQEVSAGKSRSLVHVPSNELQSSNLFYLQNGVAYRQYLGFDMSKIPIASSISSANFEITLNPDSSKKNNYGQDSLVSLFVGNDNSPVITSSKYSTTSTSSGNRVYRFEVVRYIQNWLLPTATQRRLVLFGYSERTTLDRFAFYGKSWLPDSLRLRPKIIITYTPPPQHRSAKQ